MELFLNYALHLFFFTTFITIYLLIAYKLRVFKTHPKRPASTIALKLSYMFFLGLLFINLYGFLFFTEYKADGRVLISLNAFLFSLLVVVPNLTIYFRRRIVNNRTLYNYLFTSYNLAIYVALLYTFFNTKWVFHL